MYRLMVHGIVFFLWAGPLALASQDISFIDMAIRDIRADDMFTIQPVHSLESQAEKPGVTDNLIDRHAGQMPALICFNDEMEPGIVLGRCFVETSFSDITLAENGFFVGPEGQPDFSFSSEKSIYDPTQIVVYLDQEGNRLVVSIDARPDGAMPINATQSCIAVIQLTRHRAATSVAVFTRP